jgi:hypothetical protein
MIETSDTQSLDTLRNRHFNAGPEETLDCGAMKVHQETLNHCEGSISVPNRNFLQRRSGDRKWVELLNPGWQGKR